MELAEDMITVFERPGNGFSFDKTAIKRFSV
jgi:hypothetical protein